MSRHRQIKAKSGNNEVTLHDNETDSPVIPIAQIERLHAIRPDKVDWFFQQTELEASARRIELNRINTFVFIERLAGIFCGFVVAAGGISGSIWLASTGHDAAATVIGGTTLVSMVSAFIATSKKKNFDK